MSTPIPNGYEILEACRTVVEGADFETGRVVIDPLYESEGIRYAAHVYDSSTGRHKGWVLELGPEQPPVRTSPGVEQFVTVLLHAFCEVQSEWETGVTSLEHFHLMVDAVKTEFKDGTNENLGFGAACRIREHPYSPVGYPREPLDPERNDSPHLHYGPLQMLLWIRDC
jgi:hypothetical protein